MQNSDFWIRITSLYWSQPSSVVFACKTATFGSELQVSNRPSPHQWFLHAKQRRLDQNYKSLWVPALICGFCMQNSDFCIRITSLYWSKPSSVVFACKTATLGTELQVSMGSRHHLWFFAFKTGTLAPELQVSICPSPHLRFLHAKKRLWIRITSLYGSQTSPMVFCMQNSDFSTRIYSLYGSQISPVVLCMQNNVISIRITCLYVSQPSSVVFAFKTATLALELQVSIGGSPHPWFLHAKQRLFDQNYKSLWVPDLTFPIVHAKQRD